MNACHRRWAKWALLAAVVAIVVWAVLDRAAQVARVEQVAVETHTWACAYKNGIRQDYLATRAFVIDIRRGLRELPAGFTMTDVREAQQRRLDRLAETRTLNCS